MRLLLTGILRRAQKYMTIILFKFYSRFLCIIELSDDPGNHFQEGFP